MSLVMRVINDGVVNLSVFLKEKSSTAPKTAFCRFMAKPVEDRAPKMTPSMPRAMAPMVSRIMTAPMRYT